MIFSSVACNLDVHLLSAALPLFQESRVEAIEWSFDTHYQRPDVPEWFTELLEAFSTSGRLIGHGVFFSLFSGRWSADQANWLKELKRVADRFPFDHLSEHFGYMTGRDFHQGAPLPIPFTASTLAIGIDRLKRIQDACGCPVGLENLAFSYALDEVKKHGEFLERLVSPVNGFLILDLHNLYCQMHNFNVSGDDLLSLYCLDRVREIHISGGSWDTAIDNSRFIRRDTHDDGVPQEVFQLLKNAIPLCSNLRFVVLEQMGTALHTAESRQRFQEDFLRMSSITAGIELPGTTGGNDFLPGDCSVSSAIPEDHKLYEQQRELSAILENAKSLREVQDSLSASSLADSEWHIESWEPSMMETARRIARKWKG